MHLSLPQQPFFSRIFQILFLYYYNISYNICTSTLVWGFNTLSYSKDATKWLFLDFEWELAFTLSLGHARDNTFYYLKYAVGVYNAEIRKIVIIFRLTKKSGQLIRSTHQRSFIFHEEISPTIAVAGLDESCNISHTTRLEH